MKHGCEIEEFSGDETWKIPVYTLLCPPSCNPVFPPGLPRSEEQRFCCHLQFRSSGDIGVERHHLCGSHPLQSLLPKGELHKYTDYEKVKQKGVDGQNIVTQKVQKVNGETTNATTINTEVVKEPIKEIVIKGTRKRQSGESGSYTGEAYGDLIKTKGTWGWPATCSTVSSPFGYRWGTLHDGTDIYGCGYGSKIFAAQSGKVVQSEYMAYPNGHYITIEHDNGYYTLYAHLSARYVKAGDVVSKGQVIGAMGKTGAATGVHLHFGMWTGYPYRGGRPVNAMNYY